jgi:hypothetical protein
MLAFNYHYKLHFATPFLFVTHTHINKHLLNYMETNHAAKTDEGYILQRNTACHRVSLDIVHPEVNAM